MENPFYDYDYYYVYFFNNRQVFDVPCFLNQLVFRNTDTNEIFQAEYAGTCSSYDTNNVQITMNPRDYLKLVVDEFINTTSTTTPLEMYTADMFVVPFNLRIEPDDPIECDVRKNLYSNARVTDTDYWTDEGILLIHFNTFIEVATVDVSKLSLSRNYYQDANNTVNITSGEILNQSPSLARSVGIKLTLSDLALLASKGICTGSNKSLIQDCYLSIQSGFAALYHGVSVSPSTGYSANTFQRALTGELNVLAFSSCKCTPNYVCTLTIILSRICSSDYVHSAGVHRWIDFGPGAQYRSAIHSSTLYWGED